MVFHLSHACEIAIIKNIDVERRAQDVNGHVLQIVSIVSS